MNDPHVFVFQSGLNEQTTADVGADDDIRFTGEKFLQQMPAQALCLVWVAQHVIPGGAAAGGILRQCGKTNVWNMRQQFRGMIRLAQGIALAAGLMDDNPFVQWCERQGVFL